MRCLLLLMIFSSCVMETLNNGCLIIQKEITFNWDTFSKSKWNFTCIEFLERLQSNQKCFIGMDTNQVIKIFGNKYVSTLHSDGGRALQFPVQPDTPVYKVVRPNEIIVYCTLDFLVVKDIVKKVGYSTLSGGMPVK